MMLGTALTAVLQGTIVGFGFWIVGPGNGLFWGGVTAVASMVPVVGSALVWLPAARILALGGRYGAAAGLAAIGGIIASNIDNVLRPVIYRRVSNIHPMITLVGAFAGARVFGFVGVLLGALAISHFLELVRAYDQEYGFHPTTETPPGACPGGGCTVRTGWLSRRRSPRRRRGR
jgi:predicted PurR-regulated permease PerM